LLHGDADLQLSTDRYLSLTFRDRSAGVLANFWPKADMSLCAAHVCFRG